MAVNTSTGFEASILGPSAFEGIFRAGCIEIRTGPQPDTADMPATGALLARITVDGGIWRPGVSAYGLGFVRNGRYVYKDAAQRWVLRGLAAGTAGWFRLVGNAPDAGAVSFESPRIDGAIGLDDDSPGDFQMRLPTLAMATDTSIEIGEWWFAIPPL
ncbi:hypothetical protein [Stenotrophomonas muris]|uniref:hypothetical protein n=1 Tax=Stenotrophomonas muris TaxID=2963283 RepID=UPI003F802971